MGVIIILLNIILAEIFGHLSGCANDPDGKEEIEQMKNDINDVEKFHKTDFHRHLDVTFKSQTTAICTCIKCGMGNNGGCDLHKEKRHSEPCSQCQQGFDIISKLWDFYHLSLEKIEAEKRNIELVISDIEDQVTQTDDNKTIELLKSRLDLHNQ